MATGQFLRANVPIWGGVYQFKERAQLRGPPQNGDISPQIVSPDIGDLYRKLGNLLTLHLSYE